MRFECPMPNDKLDDSTVIASRDQENGQYIVLVLNQTPEYYSVLVLSADDGNIDDVTNFGNIIPATEFYSDAIGGY